MRKVFINQLERPKHKNSLYSIELRLLQSSLRDWRALLQSSEYIYIYIYSGKLILQVFSLSIFEKRCLLKTFPDASTRRASSVIIQLYRRSKWPRNQILVDSCSVNFLALFDSDDYNCRDKYEINNRKRSCSRKRAKIIFNVGTSFQQKRYTFDCKQKSIWSWLLYNTG